MFQMIHARKNPGFRPGILRVPNTSNPPQEGDHVMHEITPIALTELFLGAGCAALFGYCVYIFVSVCCRRTARSRRRKG